jgi:hypothetical protein
MHHWALGPSDHLLHSAFATNILEGFYEDNGLLEGVVFAVEKVWYLLLRLPSVSQGESVVNSVGIRCSEKPYVVLTP